MVVVVFFCRSVGRFFFGFTLIFDDRGKNRNAFFKRERESLNQKWNRPQKVGWNFFFGHFSNFKRDCHVVRPCNILVFPFGIFQKMFFLSKMRVVSNNNFFREIYNYTISRNFSFLMHARLPTQYVFYKKVCNNNIIQKTNKYVLSCISKKPS